MFDCDCKRNSLVLFEHTTLTTHWPSPFQMTSSVYKVENGQKQFLYYKFVSSTSVISLKYWLCTVTFLMYPWLSPQSWLSWAEWLPSCGFPLLTYQMLRRRAARTKTDLQKRTRELSLGEKSPSVADHTRMHWLSALLNNNSAGIPPLQHPHLLKI